MSGFDASADRSRRSPWAAFGSSSQADSLLDELFKDLEHSLEEEAAEEYPYWGTRPPLPLRRSSATSGILGGLALAASLVAGLAFWVTLHLQARVFSQVDPPWSRNLLTAVPNSPNSDFSRPPAARGETPRAPYGGVLSQKPSGAVLANKLEAKPIPARPAKIASAAAVGAGSAPPPLRVAAPRALARIQAQPVPQMKLVGLIRDPGDPKALILVDNVVRQVPVGQAVKAEWRVTAIGDQGVTVSNGARTFTLQLGLSQQI